MHNRANLSESQSVSESPTARRQSASPRSQVSQDSSRIRPGKLKPSAFRGGGGGRVGRGGRKLRGAGQKGNC